MARSLEKRLKRESSMQKKRLLLIPGGGRFPQKITNLPLASKMSFIKPGAAENGPRAVAMEGGIPYHEHVCIPLRGERVFLSCLTFCANGKGPGSSRFCSP